MIIDDDKDGNSTNEEGALPHKQRSTQAREGRSCRLAGWAVETPGKLQNKKNKKIRAPWVGGALQHAQVKPVPFTHPADRRLLAMQM